MAPRFPSNLSLGLAGSVAFHALFAVGQARASRSPEPVLLLSTEVDIGPLPPPEAEAEPDCVPAPIDEAHAEPEPPAETPRARVSPPSSDAASAARAGRTITAPDSPAAGQDTADFSLVQGEGVAYAGGTTASQGTSASAVHGPAASTRPEAVPERLPVPIPRPAPTFDRSRPAVPTLLDWNCSRLYPTDPDAGNAAAVVIVVTVRPGGSAQSVAVVRDPGHGFGDAARACALSQRFTPALDQGGNPITSVTAPITVRFSR